MKDILTMEEACAWLGIPRSTMYKLLEGGKIPGARKLGGRWKFTRKALEKYMGCEITHIPEMAPSE